MRRLALMPYPSAGINRTCPLWRLDIDGEDLMAKRTSSLTSTSILALAVGLTTLSAHANLRTHDDYIAIDIEGEANDNKDDRWVLTEPTTPSQEQDPDGNHSDTAAGNAYLELLPDIRVNNGDPFGPPTAIWGAAGTGPELNYEVDFPEAGRYFVHVRALSTGTEDNGIHVGIDDEWPSSGERMQWCTSGGGWQWSSRQRDSGGAGPCGVSHTIWIDVPTPGTHNVNFSAREDGFEFDRFMLIKDLSDNTRICQPFNENSISCIDGSLESADDIVDLGVQIEADLAMVKTGEDVGFTLTVINEDSFDTADNVEVNITAAIGSDWEVVSVDEACLIAGTDLVCQLGSIIPSNPEEVDHSYSFTLRALVAGISTLDASISSTEIDDFQANDEASVSVDIEDENPLTTVSVDLTGDLSSLTLDEPFTITLSLVNTGIGPAFDVNTDIAFPTGLNLDERVESCAGTTILTCEFGDLEASESIAIDLVMTATTDGFKNLLFTPAADNLIEELAPIQRSLLVVTPPSSSEQDEEPEVEVDAEVDVDSGAGSWMLLAGLMTVIVGRRRYAPAKALR